MTLTEIEKERLIASINMHDSGKKVCLECGRELSIKKFSYASKTYDNKEHVCRDCKYKHLTSLLKEGIR